MTFGPDESAGARITSLDEYNRCLDLFQKEGYNEVDTGRMYVGGKQEATTRETRWKERGLTLATKIKSTEVPQEGRYSDTAGAVAEMYQKRYFRDSTFGALRSIEGTAQKHGLTLLEIALRWCIHHSALKMQNGGRDGVIIGVSSFSQVESNLKDLEKGPLPEGVVKTLDGAWSMTKATTPNYWHSDLEYTYDAQEALFKPQ
ncbi:MAG: hypothetical protein Q9199_006499 [Rusavskia elegans]